MRNVRMRLGRLHRGSPKKVAVINEETYGLMQLNSLIDFNNFEAEHGRKTIELKLESFLSFLAKTFRNYFLLDPRTTC